MINQPDAEETGKKNQSYLFTVGAEDEIFSKKVNFLQTVNELCQEALVTGQDNKQRPVLVNFATGNQKMQKRYLKTNQEEGETRL